MQTQTQEVRWTKLRSGEWGVKGPAAALQPGAVVEVHKKDGSTSQATVRRVLWTGDGVALAAVEQRGNGHGRSRRACVTGGNCSSFGAGRSCGGYDCDGYEYE